MKVFELKEKLCDLSDVSEKFMTIYIWCDW